MISFKSPLLITFILFTSTQAAQFTITNNCPYTVWSAAIRGSIRQLSTAQSWTITVNLGTTSSRIWGRTSCKPTGNCGRFLQFTGYGSPSNTLAEYSLGDSTNLDFFDISLVEGFNVPMQFAPSRGSCTKKVMCNPDVMGQCPDPLRVNGGCNDGCTALNQPQYCCPSDGGACNPMDYLRFFKNLCPTSYSYPSDDATSTFTCPSGIDYKEMAYSSTSLATTDKVPYSGFPLVQLTVEGWWNYEGRFWGCPEFGTYDVKKPNNEGGCNFTDWIDPPFSPRAQEVIGELWKERNALSEQNDGLMRFNYVVRKDIKYLDKVRVVRDLRHLRDPNP